MGGSTNLVFVFFGGVGKFELGASAGLSTNSALSSLSALAFPTRIVSCFVCFPSSATLRWKKAKIALHISAIAINRHFFRRCRDFPQLFHLPSPGYSINSELSA